MRSVLLLCLSLLVPLALAEAVLRPGLESVFRSAGLLSGGVEWTGTAPLCSQKCPSNEVVVAKAGSPDETITLDGGFGKDCWGGSQKSLCTSQYRSCTTRHVIFPLICNSVSVGVETFKRGNSAQCSAQGSTTTMNAAFPPAHHPRVHKETLFMERGSSRTRN
ncbi:hypothetical protein CALVIDRAFT_543236 [Calocera viscosa TUFC12733]|uniref:Secreted protein n=1 Tax=Calocera viscosa (strain TUFC12733) TaxID=1330018 RepID=A0A167FT06_CALVF|nr:hypothetical protein CALVIDRAFT_543517 [Calocera viscosa TUFC12733]KZO89813.1 hypothetical protein CALVIDRAFT_543236 [Calocera viscosa TUFC12733]